MVYGYKCFKKGLVNSYGVRFKIGEIYHTDGNVIFGVKGNGFHLCERLEDTLRFFDAISNDVDICSVIGFGECIKRDDEYNDYYDMYVCENMYIVKKLTRDEIISYGLNLPEIGIMRFLSLFKLTDDEKKLFRDKFKENYLINKYIDYYQDDVKTAFVRELVK